MNKVISVLFIALMFCGFTGTVLAIPTFQVWSEQGISGTIGPDEDTWFVTQSSFDLIVVGNFQDSVSSLTSVTLVVSVPKGSEGVVTVEGATFLSFYTTKADFLPTPILDDDDNIVNFNNHYPFQDGVSDFLLFELADFVADDTYGPVHDYNAEEGEYDPDADATGGYGQERLYSVTVEGFDWAHFDVYGLADDTWRINPGSHDTTFIPAPGALLLGSMGMGIVGWLRRRRMM